MNDQGMRQPGERLRAEREARGISREDVANRLNLTVTFIEALETDDYDRLPEATFVRGYIRNYARELDLPADELVSVFSELVHEQEEVPETVEVMPSGRRRWLPVALVAMVVAVGVALLLWPDDQVAEGDGSASTEEPGAGSAEQDLPAQSSGAAEETPGPGQDTSEMKPEAGPEREPARPAPSQNGQQSDSVDSLDRLELTFSDDCWLEARDATGEVVFEGRREGGAALNLSGEAPFDLRIGDASAVESLSINDEQKTMPSNAAGQVVRLSVP